MAIIKKPTSPVKLAPLFRGSRFDLAGNGVSNVILLSLPNAEYRMLRPHLQPVDLPQHEILHEPGEKIQFTYFLNEGMVSLVALSRDGRSVEVGIVGKEGMVGMPLTMGLRREIFRAIMQIEASSSSRAALSACQERLAHFTRTGNWETPEKTASLPNASASAGSREPVTRR